MGTGVPVEPGNGGARVLGAGAAPQARGETSHTVLVTNLANRVQPVIRYDLGDAVVAHSGRCACGNPMPAIRVEGRRDDIVVLHDEDREARIPPMALTTVLEEATGTHRFQIVQREPDCLLLRLATGDAPERERVFRIAAKAIHDYLTAQGIARTRILLDDAPRCLPREAASCARSWWNLRNRTRNG